MPADKQYVNELQEKAAVSSVFMATDKMIHTDRNGKPFMSLNLCDATGSINGRLWDKVEELAQRFEAGDFIQVKGHVQVYQNRKQVVIHDLHKAEANDVTLKDFIAKGESDPEELHARVLIIVETISNQYIKQLILSVLNDSEIKPHLLKAPAAKTIHHAYMGGLLEHIVSICSLMDSIAKHYTFLDRDLLMFGAIFHDIGKVSELSIDTGIRYTDAGRLVGHMAIACEWIDKKASQIEDFPADLKDVLKHIVLSHHGRLEYGSPKLPMLIEAMVVAMIDELDSRIDMVAKFMKEEVSTGEDWTRYHSQLERYFYLKFFRNKTRDT